LLARNSRLLYGTMFVAHTPVTFTRLLFARIPFTAIVVGMLSFGCDASAAETIRLELVDLQGSVEVLHKDQREWQPAKINIVLGPGDAIRTRKDSRAAIRTDSEGIIRLDQLSTLRIPEQVSPRKRFLINLLKGAAYFFHRERPAQTDFETPLVSGAIRGTEFNLAVAGNGKTVVSLIDGEVALSNPQGELALSTGEEAVVEPASAPRKSSMLDATNIIQWCLYYPAVLDVPEIPFSESERQALQDSIAAYSIGNLPNALALYPAERQAGGDGERIYRAQLHLAAGQVAEAEQAISALQEPNAKTLAEALRVLIAAVKFQKLEFNPPRQTASGLLAKSYYAQSRSGLEEALTLARAAVRQDAKFAYGWARVAELEFSFGHTAQAKEAIQTALKLSPQNAQALATKGFILAAEGKFRAAREEFDRAIALDGALANGWLGRGLSQFRMGHAHQGREDLLVAAALEPNRAVLRSYLGKAFDSTSQGVLAEKELLLAKRFDPNDPTAWLYSALLNQRRNRINHAIDDLEHSIELNNNRQVYRSALLLDEDRAVRGANLANIYSDAGFTDPAFREAARSANRDYSDFSSHLFLANSYNQLRDPRQINLRYEAPWLNEYLLANLLAPIEAGTLSPLISEQEYGRFFERNRVGLVSSTEYQSRGDWAQAAAQYGIYNNLAYSADAVYRSQNGYRPNNDLDQLTVSLQVKARVAPNDSAYFQAVYYRAESGDLSQYYDQNSANTGLRIKETQEPLLIGGWHHEWNPENHTLLLAGHFQDTFSLTNPSQRFLAFQRGSGGTLLDAGQIGLPLGYRNELEIYTAELQHIWQHGDYRVIAGGRFQTGDFRTENQAPGFFFVPATSGSFESHLERNSIYAYGHWKPCDGLLLVAGLSYDRLAYPENFRAPPVNGNENRTDHLSPKAGFIWTPWKETTVRGAYTRSLGGVTFDQSFQLEPSQIAGFNQTFRSLIPESVAGALSAQRFETIGLALDQKLATRTYIGFSGEWLRSRSTQRIGTYDFVFPDVGTAATTREQFKFDEKSFFVSFNQLLGNDWALGAQYRLSHADLDMTFPDVPSSATASGGFAPSQNPAATLQQLQLFANYNHSCGFFSQLQGVWSLQENRNLPGQPGDHFWQWNAFVGYRFPLRRAEITAGVLNIGNRNYRLNPLTLYSELPRERTAVVNLRFYF
jgi:Flp pilus assembly protein TadD